MTVRQPRKPMPARPGRGLLRALTELAPDFVALLDRQGLVRYVSPAVTRVAGWAPDELLGHPWLDLVSPKDAKTAAALIGHPPPEGTPPVLLRLRRRRGSGSVALEVFARALPAAAARRAGNGKGGVLLSTRDVTRHVQSLRDVRDCAKVIEDLYEHAPCGYHSVNPQGVLTRINATELGWLQYERHELVGKMRFADLLTPATRETYLRGLALLWEIGEIRNVECEAVRRDGSVLPLLWHATVARDADGKPRETRAALYDISERRHAERALHRVNRALRVLSSARERIIRASDEAGMLAAVCEVFVTDGGYRMAMVHEVVHDARFSMKPVAIAGASAERLANAGITWADTERGRGPVGTAVRTGITQVNRDFANNPNLLPFRPLALELGCHASIATPLLGDEGVFAVLSVYAGEPDAFGFEEYELLRELGGDIAFAVAALRGRILGAPTANEARGQAQAAGLLSRLSPRERQVLKLVVEGRTSKEIGAVLNVRPASVDTYRSRVMVKLGLEDLPGLVRFAIRSGVISA